MMPIIRPLDIRNTPQTEYQKEMQIVAKLKVEFRSRNPVMQRISQVIAKITGRSNDC